MFRHFGMICFLLFVSGCMNMPIDRHPSSGYSGYKGESYGEVSLSDLSKRDSQQKSMNVAARKPTSISMNPPYVEKEISEIIESNDIFLGMEMSAVQESWGVPDQVFIAGDERHKNQVWKYTVPVQTAQDFKIEERLVKFQNGRVVGWQGR